MLSFLPWYAPELNPVEPLWSHMKSAVWPTAGSGAWVSWRRRCAPI
ncbi:transposase [Nocardiopsis terrae]